MHNCMNMHLIWIMNLICLMNMVDMLGWCELPLDEYDLTTLLDATAI